MPFGNVDPVLILKMYGDKWRLPWETIEGLCSIIRHQWGETLYHPKRIVALGRGGMVPARLLAKEDIPVYYEGIRSYDDSDKPGDIDHFQRWIPNDGEFVNDYSTLIVDDVWDQGSTFRYAKGLYPNAAFASLITKVPAEDTFLDYVGLSFPTKAWIKFPWEKNNG